VLALQEAREGMAKGELSEPAVHRAYRDAKMSLERERLLAAAIAGIPRVGLGTRNTPLEPAPRLSEWLGGPPIYLKRDDLTGLGFGGNKTRMLEFSLADARSKGADAVVSGMAVQSNYCRQLAAACARLGLECHLVLRPVRPVDHEAIQGNHLLQRLFGAHITRLDSADRAAQARGLAERVQALRDSGRRVYVPREPDTVDLDAIAYAEVALEIVSQVRDLGLDPQLAYVASVDTTQAGLVMGFAALQSPIMVRGFCPVDGASNRKEEMADIANQAARRLGLDVTLRSDDFDNDDSTVGEGYGVPTQEGLDALHAVARLEGVLLDPVYTSKAMGALFRHVRDGALPADTPVVFVHTGGAPALFGYADEVIPGTEDFVLHG